MVTSPIRKVDEGLRKYYKHQKKQHGSKYTTSGFFMHMCIGCGINDNEVGYEMQQPWHDTCLTFQEARKNVGILPFSPNITVDYESEEAMEIMSKYFWQILGKCYYHPEIQEFHFNTWLLPPNC